MTDPENPNVETDDATVTEVPETVEYTEENPLVLPSGKVWHADGKTYREDNAGSVYVADIEYADDIKVLADLYPDRF